MTEFGIRLRLFFNKQSVVDTGCDDAQTQPCSPHPTAAPKDTNQGADVPDWVIPQSERVKMTYPYGFWFLTC